MEPDERPRTGQTRLSDVGDVEIFDGAEWQPVGTAGSVLVDPQLGSRQGPDGGPLRAGSRDASGGEPDHEPAESGGDPAPPDPGD
ncbi:hypothetical protein [Catenulispora subtropica]|uniref:Uncharacterized protein n=1 Tax=Catenulispora subtropica TaxID=450798 RepID=A0ABP5EEP9_9ACTN